MTKSLLSPNETLLAKGFFENQDTIGLLYLYENSTNKDALVDHMSTIYDIDIIDIYTQHTADNDLTAEQFNAPRTIPKPRFINITRFKNHMEVWRGHLPQKVHFKQSEICRERTKMGPTYWFDAEVASECIRGESLDILILVLDEAGLIDADCTFSIDIDKCNHVPAILSRSEPMDVESQITIGKADQNAELEAPRSAATAGNVLAQGDVTIYRPSTDMKYALQNNITIAESHGSGRSTPNTSETTYSISTIDSRAVERCESPLKRKAPDDEHREKIIVHHSHMAFFSSYIEDGSCKIHHRSGQSMECYVSAHVKRAYQDEFSKRVKLKQ